MKHFREGLKYQVKELGILYRVESKILMKVLGRKLHDKIRVLERLTW